MKNKQIFREKDKVFHWKYGWGKVVACKHEGYYTQFQIGDAAITVTVPENELSFTKYDFKVETGGLSHERPFKLEVGKSYRRKGDSTLVINRVGIKGNYGFNSSGEWAKYIICCDESIWREATDEEVKAALLVEVNKRFGLYPESKRIVEGVHCDPDFWNPEGFSIENIKGEGWQVSNQYGCLFYKGKWAEPLEEDTKQDEEFQLKPFQKVLVRDFDDEQWKIELFSHMNRKYVCLSSFWSQCIPYEGNEHLLGTSKYPEQ